MKYDGKRLRKLARDVLKLAQANLQRDGYLQPIGLIYTNAGLSQVFQFSCQNLYEKRVSQDGFRQLLVKMKARAAIVVTESWLKTAPDLPLDLTRSVADMPGRKEVIVIEAASPKAKCIIIQVFNKDETGKIHFEDAMEPDHPISWSSEWRTEYGTTTGENNYLPDKCGAEYFSGDHMDQIDRWIQIGLKNSWIAQAYDPPLTRASFYECRTPEDLKEKFEHGNWCLGQAFFYRDICFINKIEGGDEWLTIRHDIAFESISWQVVIRDGEFINLLNRLLRASPEQCKRLKY